MKTDHIFLFTFFTGRENISTGYLLKATDLELVLSRPKKEILHLLNIHTEKRCYVSEIVIGVPGMEHFFKICLTEEK